MEAFETEKETAQREIKEEIGISVDFVQGFRETVQYEIADGKLKTVVLFLAECRENITTDEKEIEKYEWLSDEISEKNSIITLSCNADIAADCYYEDYTNAPWDPEEKEYLFVDTVKIREEHKASFGCRIEIDRKLKSFNLFPFTVVLDGDSRIKMYEIDEYTNEDNEE